MLNTTNYITIIHSQQAVKNQWNDLYFRTNFQASGITKPIPHINPSIAEEALEQLKTKVTSLDRELQDLKFKVYKSVYV